MRKVETQMCDAIASNADYWRLNNTAVKRRTIRYERPEGLPLFKYVITVHDVYLHGNHIATVSTNWACPFVQVFDGGWQSVTTKSRLNALLDTFTDPTRNGVFQRNWEWFVRTDGVVSPFSNGHKFEAA